MNEDLKVFSLDEIKKNLKDVRVLEFKNGQYTGRLADNITAIEFADPQTEEE